MKRISLIAIILLVACTVVFAQQSGGSSLPTSAQTKQSAQQSLTQGRTNSSQFESGLNDLKARNQSNMDLDAYNRLKSEIDQLEAQIITEQTRIGTTLDRGAKVSPALLDRVQRLIDQHKTKLEELEGFSQG